jgi:SAM-dependent methyltransferase
MLDVGCGTGHMTVEALKAGYDVTAIDISNKMLELTKEVVVAENFYADIQKVDIQNDHKFFKSKVFNNVVCLDVMEHLVDDSITIKNLYQVLDEKGRLLLTVPAFKFLYGKRDQKLGHYRRYDKEELRGKLEKNGFQILKMKYWNFLGFLVLYFLEKVLKKEFSEGIRYSKGLHNKIFNKIIYFWLLIESKIEFLPFGLTLFIIAEKNSYEI